MVAAEHVLLARPAVAHMQAQLRTAGRKLGQAFAHRMLGAVAHTVEQPDPPRGRFGEHRFEHRQQRGEADAARDQHDRLGARLQNEIPGGRARLDQISDLKMIMQMTGDHARLRLDHALDRDAVMIGMPSVGQGITAHLGARRARAVGGNAHAHT